MSLSVKYGAVVQDKLVNIQHLRAFAVFVVFMFHLELSAFDWGFIGVDIFFVISGYIMALITANRDFQFIYFISRRIKRLVPALLLMLVAVLIMCFFLQTREELYITSVTALTNLVASASFYISNTTGYFDVETKFRPLLHTWSLSIEWLCYLLLSVVLLIKKQKTRINVVYAIIVIACLYLVCKSLMRNEIDYYDFIARTYLFFCGYLYFQHKNNNLYRYMHGTLACFIASIVFALLIVYLSNKNWPNLGTIFLPAMIFPFLSTNLLARMPRTSLILSYIGDISYSLYLWHWPVIWVTNIRLSGASMDWSSQFYVVGITLGLSVISYHFIEKKNFYLKYLVTVLAAGILLCITVINIYSDQRNAALVAKRIFFVDKQELYEKSDMLVHGCAFQVNIFENHEICLFVKPEPETYKRIDGKTFWLKQSVLPKKTPGEEIMIVGDSHSKHFVPILLSDDNIRMVHRMVINIDQIETDKLNATSFLEDKKYFDIFSDYLQQRNIKQLYIAYRFINKSDESKKLFVNFMDKLITHFRNKELNITIFRDIPSFTLDPLRCLNLQRLSFLDDGCEVDFETPVSSIYVTNSNDHYWEILNKKYSNISYINMLDTHKALCNIEGCKAFIMGKLIYRDTNHFNERLSDVINSKLYELMFNVVK